MRIANICWLVIYIAMLSAVFFGLTRAHHYSVNVFSTPAAHADWEQWRQDVNNEVVTEGNTDRKPITNGSPPALVLMRDYFWPCAIFALVFSSLLFFTLMVTIRGALQPTVTSED